MIQVGEAQLAAWIASFMLPFFRILALFSAAPVLSQRSLPVRVRIGVSLLLAAALAPSVAPPPNFDPTSLGALGFVAQEVVVGLAIGFVARLLFAAFDFAGEIIGLQMGLSFAGFFDPGGGHGTAIGSFMSTMAMMIFVALNGPLLLIGATMRSFRSLPVTDVPFGFAAGLHPVAIGAEVFVLGMTIAVPFIALILFVNLLLGVMSRIAPQLSLFSVGLPVTITVGLLLLVFGLPSIERPIVEGLSRLFAMFG